MGIKIRNVDTDSVLKRDKFDYGPFTHGSAAVSNHLVYIARARCQLESLRFTALTKNTATAGGHIQYLLSYRPDSGAGTTIFNQAVTNESAVAREISPTASVFMTAGGMLYLNVSSNSDAQLSQARIMGVVRYAKGSQ